MPNDKQSAGQIAQGSADTALNALSEHDSRIEEAEAALEAAELHNRDAVRGTTDLAEAKQIKMSSTAEVAVYTDLIADLLTERVALVDALTLAFEGIGQAKFDTKEAQYLAGMKIVAKGMKIAEPGITMMADADKTLSAQEPFSLLDEVPNQMVRMFLEASGKGIKIPNRRQLDSYEEIIDFYGSGQSSRYSLKLAKHQEKTGKWSLADRDSDAYRTGRATFLKNKNKRAKKAG
jgi:hypothetical protein